MTRTAIVLSKVFIVVLAATGLLTQVVLLPDQAAYTAALNPEVAFLETPMLILAILFIACGQVVLACVWVLLSLVRRNTIFSVRAVRFVDVMIGALLASVVVILSAYFMAQAAEAVPPALFLFTVAASLGGTALGLVVLVMRGLLVRAYKHESYLAEVV